MKRITNVDSLSALIDRLITERIKLFFFERDNKEAEIIHQRELIAELKLKISDLFVECFLSSGYDYIGERRTFDENAIVESIDQLVGNDLWIGEGDRARLKEITSEQPDFDVILKYEKVTRKSCESRAKNKNTIDRLLENLFARWKKTPKQS